MCVCMYVFIYLLAENKYTVGEIIFKLNYKKENKSLVMCQNSLGNCKGKLD